MKTYIIKIWETEELRDLGESDIVEIDLDSLKKAISRAKEIMEEQNYASLEVQDSEETESYYFCTPKEEEYLYDFEEDDIEEKIKRVVELYFAEKGLGNLMDYGYDRDSLAMPTITDLYKELMEKLNIQCCSIETDDISDGKYRTVIEFENGNSITVDTSAWNNEEIVSDNMISIQEEYEKTQENVEEEDLER